MKTLTTIIGCTFCFALLASGRGESSIDQGLLDLVQAIDQKAETVSTLKADFTQIKEISLLTEPVEMRGTFFLKKPDGMKFYAVPEDDLIIVITEKEMVSLSPKVKKASRFELKKRRDFLTQNILTKRLEAMLGFFNIRKSANADANGDHHLVLKPIRRKYKKKFKKIELWVNSDYIIYKVILEQKDGDVFKLELKNIQVNVPIDSSEFSTAIPSDYEMGERMSFILGSDLGF